MRLAITLILALAACRGSKPATPACTSDSQCEEQFRDQCPGGSVAYATCTKGTCQFEACSSPIGTPCDDDPATQFDDENCPE